MGRPRKAQPERRSKRITLRLTEEEHSWLEGMAVNTRKTQADYARTAMIGCPIVVKQTRELPFEVIHELNRIGVNLNQMARKLNATGQRSSDVSAVLDRLNALLDSTLEDYE